MDTRIFRTRGGSRIIDQEFQPHAILLTEKPATSLVVSMMRPRLKTIRFEPGSDPATFVHQVLERLPDEVEFFGRITGFAMNYAEDRVDVYDRQGNRLRSQSTPVLP